MRGRDRVNAMQDALHDSREYPVFIPAKFDELGLTLEAFRVYCHLCRRASRETRTAYPSYARIGEDCFRGSYPNSSIASLKAKAIAAVAELVEYGLIRKELYDEGEGYSHNIYHLTPQSEWRSPEVINTCNVRKGRQGLARKKSVNGDNPVNQVNSVNGDNRSRLTGITPPVNGVQNSVNPTPPKGITKGLKGIPIKEIPIKELDLLSNATRLDDRDRRVEASNEPNPTIPCQPVGLEPERSPVGQAGEGTEIPPRAKTRKSKKQPRSPRSQPALSQHHPELSLALWQLWSPMWREFYGELDDRAKFMGAFDWLIEQGVEAAHIDRGARFYIGSKMAAVQQHRKDSVHKPPRGDRFFLGRDGGESYCLRAYQLAQERPESASGSLTLPEWVDTPSNPFLAWLARHYLPNRPEYRDRQIDGAIAKSWLSEAKYSPKRLELAAIAWEGFQEHEQQVAAIERQRQALQKSLPGPDVVEKPDLAAIARAKRIAFGGKSD